MNRLQTVAKFFLFTGVLATVSGCSAIKNLEIVHIPPGQSMNERMAQKAELISLPAPPPPAPGAVPVVEPALPGNSTTERVAEAYSRGEFCLGAGKDDEALAAFEEAVKIDPTFTEAWQHLAMLYEKKGDAKKAMVAFKRAKKLAVH